MNGLRREVALGATPERVWEALVVPSELARWFGAEAEIELRPGGAVRFTWPDGVVRRGLVEEVVPARRLVLRWREVRAGPRSVEVGEGTRVVFELEVDGGGTLLTLTESPLGPAFGRADPPRMRSGPDPGEVARGSRLEVQGVL